MIIRVERKFKSQADKCPVVLMSDLHIGARDCDKDLIRADLEFAKQHNGLAFINGDVFDLILPKDKRFTPSVLDPALEGSDAILNHVLKMAEDVLGPYARWIHGIGVGNHESAASKYYSTDIVALLIERLQRKAKHPINHMGYTGAIVIRFLRTIKNDASSSTAFTIWYHHGSGGASPVTKGMIDFNRAATYVGGVDALWLGHKHNRFVDHSVELSVPTTSNTFRQRTRWHIMSGAYTGCDVSPLDSQGGYRVDWAQEKGFAPQGRGGVRLWLTPVAGGGHSKTLPQVRAEVVL